MEHCVTSYSTLPSCTTSTISFIAHLHFCNQMPSISLEERISLLLPVAWIIYHSQIGLCWIHTIYCQSFASFLSVGITVLCVSPHPLSLSTLWFLYLPKPNHHRQAVSEVSVLVTAPILSQLCRLSNHITIRLSLLIGQNTQAPRQILALPDCHLCIKRHRTWQGDIA